MNTSLPTTLDAIAASVRPRYLNSPQVKDQGPGPLPAEVFPLESRTKETVEAAQTAWPELDDSFLDSTYHDAKCGGQMPCFAVLSLFNQAAALSIHGRIMGLGGYGWGSTIVEFADHGGGVLERRLNRGLDACLRPLMDADQASKTVSRWLCPWPMARDSVDLYLTYRFTGLMPDRARQIATKARAEFGTNLFLVCDAKDSWVRTEKAPADVAFPKRDPLLVGAKVVHGVVTLFLLDQFDVTLAEDYLTREFVK